eukprot:Hpha_TRINITY_DN31452_c0_g1::TRINITY_DN31452_c0_g1_i1::g.145304::m.145304
MFLSGIWLLCSAGQVEDWGALRGDADRLLSRAATALEPLPPPVSVPDPSPPPPPSSLSNGGGVRGGALTIPSTDLGDGGLPVPGPSRLGMLRSKKEAMFAPEGEFPLRCVEAMANGDSSILMSYRGTGGARDNVSLADLSAGLTVVSISLDDPLGCLHLEWDPEQSRDTYLEGYHLSLELGKPRVQGMVRSCEFAVREALKEAFGSTVEYQADTLFRERGASSTELMVALAPRRPNGDVEPGLRRFVFPVKSCLRGPGRSQINSPGREWEVKSVLVVRDERATAV